MRQPNQASYRIPKSIHKRNPGKLIPQSKRVDALGSKKENSEETLHAIILDRKSKRRRKKQILISILSIGLIAILAAVYIITSLGNTGNSVQPETVTVELGDMTATTTTSGQVMFNSQLSVMAPVSGTITEVYVKDGDVVSEGDALFLVHNAEIDNALVSAKETLDNAARVKSEIDSALADKRVKLDDEKVSYDNAVTEYHQLYEEFLLAPEATMQPIMPDASNYQNLLADVSSLEIKQQSAQQSVDQASIAYDSSLRSKEQCTIFAAVNGTVVTVNAQKGDSVIALTSKVIDLADMTSLKVEAEVNENEINMLEVGQKAKVTFDIKKGSLELEGSVESIALSPVEPDITETDKTTSYKVVLLLDNVDSRIKSGMSSSVEITTEEYSNMTVVPKQSIISIDSKNYVYVTAIDGSFEKHEVEIVANSDGKTAIIGDIDAGDEVVLNAASMSE